MTEKIEYIAFESQVGPMVQVVSTRCLLDVPDCPGVPGGLTLPGGVITTVPASGAEFLLSFPGVVRLQPAEPADPVPSPAPLQAEAPDAERSPLTPPTEV